MWTFDPKIPMALWWALLVASAGAIGWYASRTDRGLSLAQRSGLTLMLLAGLMGPLLIALNPTWVETIPPIPGQPMVTVLVDGTLSMQTEDCGTSGIDSRWRQALEISELVQNEGDSDVVIRKQVLGDQVENLPTSTQSDESGTWPRGHRTNLSSGIHSVIRSGSPVGHAVLMIGDGAHNVGSIDGVLQAARESNALATPIYTVTLGTSLGMKNLSLVAKSARMIAFPDSPVTIRANLSHSGLEGQSTEVNLLVEDEVLEKRIVRLTAESNQDIAFNLDDGVEGPLTRFRIIASEVNGEATSADNQTTVLVQRLGAPVAVLLLEGKPYWDSKFLSRNLARDAVVDLTAVVQLSRQRFLTRKVASPTKDVSDQNVAAGEESWTVDTGLNSPLESPEVLEQYRVVMLGRDADAYLTESAIENLRIWISESGGCLLCSRGAPTDQVVSKLAEILPVRWVNGAESRFRTKLSSHGMDSSVFDSLLGSGVDPLGSLPSLAATSVPKIRTGLPQILVEGANAGADGAALPVVTYQPYGRGQTVVVEGAGMWRWAFLPPQFADKDQIYPTLWQAMIQWIVSQQDMMPGQEVAIRADRANFLSGDRATASVTVLDPGRWRTEQGKLDLAVTIQSLNQDLPKRISLVPSGMEDSLFRADLGTLEVGYYGLQVVTGEKDEVLAATAFEVRDPWFESLEVDARPDVMRQIARLSGGEALSVEEIPGLVKRFADRLKAQQTHEEIRTSMWDRPLVLILVLAGWIATWIVRRRCGLI